MYFVSIVNKNFLEDSNFFITFNLKYFYKLIVNNFMRLFNFISNSVKVSLILENIKSLKKSLVSYCLVDLNLYNDSSKTFLIKNDLKYLQVFNNNIFLYNLSNNLFLEEVSAEQLKSRGILPMTSIMQKFFKTDDVYIILKYKKNNIFLTLVRSDGSVI
jgi:hypothetical protein